MATRRIFISCGVHTQEERALGQKIRLLIEEQKMTSFLAPEVHQPADLNTHVFKELQRCDGFVALLQKRGEIRYEDFPIKHRGSVWIQQEIGILFYRSFLLEREIPIAIFREKDVLHEGLTMYSIINPIEFEVEDEVLKHLSEWLRGPAFEEQPVLARREDLFLRQTRSYEDHHWLLLELIAAYSREPGDRVHQAFLGKYFSQILQEQGKDITQDPNTHFNRTLSKLVSDGMVADTYERAGGGVHFYSLELPWWDLIHDELRNRARLK